MIDYFALALTHALLAIALLRLLGRSELDREDISTETLLPEKEPSRREKRQARRQRGTRDDA